MVFIENRQLSSDQSGLLVPLLLKVAGNELLTHRIYSSLKQNPTFEKVSEVSSLLQVAEFEDWEHYREIIDCIERLNGDSSAIFDYVQDFPLGKRDHKVEDLLRLLRTTEESSVEAYMEICTMTLEHDFRTFDIAYRNLHENLHHHHLVVKVLTKGLLMSQPQQKALSKKRAMA
ncbi:MAG: ferritin-like protein [Granulosicoccus sp.]|jgi:ferritin-like protein